MSETFHIKIGRRSGAQTAPIGPKTVTVLGSHWPATWPWSGFDWSRAELRSGSIWSNDDYHLGVPWMHPDDFAHGGWDGDDDAIYRVRLKRGWKSFVQVNGAWMVSKAPPLDGDYGTPPEGQISAVITIGTTPDA